MPAGRHGDGITLASCQIGAKTKEIGGVAEPQTALENDHRP